VTAPLTVRSPVSTRIEIGPLPACVVAPRTVRPAVSSRKMPPEVVLVSVTEVTVVSMSPVFAVPMPVAATKVAGPVVLSRAPSPAVASIKAPVVAVIAKSPEVLTTLAP
jgi:hypothetical protein